MVGFDGSNYSHLINNIYKGTRNYLDADSRGYKHDYFGITNLE